MPRKPKRPRLPNLLHLRPVLAKGKWYIYVQHHGRGKAYRITADYVTETNAFIEQYKDAVAQLERMPAVSVASDLDTLSGLYAVFKKSAKFASYKEGTIKSKTGRLDRLMVEHGWKRYAQLNNNTMQDIHDGWAQTNGTEQAKKFLSDLSPLFDLAIQRGYVSKDWVNPCLNITRQKAKNEDGFRVWEPQHLQQFEEHHAIGTMPRLAYELMFWTGAAAVDAYQIGPQHIRRDTNGAARVYFDRQKTGAPINVPFHPNLQHAIEQTEIGDMVYLLTTRGTPFRSAKSFSQWFTDMVKQARLPHGRPPVGLSAHGLRKAGATAMAEDGASDHELMAFYGWKKAETSRIYTSKASNAVMATNASARLRK